MENLGESGNDSSEDQGSTRDSNRGHTLGGFQLARGVTNPRVDSSHRKMNVPKKGRFGVGDGY